MFNIHSDIADKWFRLLRSVVCLSFTFMLKRQRISTVRAYAAFIHCIGCSMLYHAAACTTLVCRLMQPACWIHTPVCMLQPESMGCIQSHFEKKCMWLVKCCRWRYRLGDSGAPIGSDHLGIEWSRDRWRHVTLKGQGREPIISKMAGDRCNDTAVATVRVPKF